MKKILVLVCLVLFLGALVSAEQAAAARFVNNNDGTVTDTQTGLMWAAQDNGSYINWYNAKSYCEGYSGGGKSGWRMPTSIELWQLYSSDAYGSVIQKTGQVPWPAFWSSEKRLGEAARLCFIYGKLYWHPRLNAMLNRALPVRSGK